MKRVAILLCALLSACKSEHEIELEDQLKEVRTSLEATESQFSELKSEIESLNGAIEAFQDSNWREIVPEVQAAAQNVETAADGVETAIESAVAAADH